MPPRTRQPSAELTGLGDAPVGSFVVDVSDEDAVAAGLAATLEQFGRIDSCFANAGVGPHPTSIDTLTAQEWRRVMSVNLDGAFFTVRAVAAQMKSQGSGGSIVFTSSVSVSDGMAFSTQYAAAKSALVAMARALAVELARDDIRVNALGARLDQSRHDRSAAGVTDRAGEDPAANPVAALGNT